MEDDHMKLVPIANVGRIMKQILPPTAKISKEAKERMQKCASEFISFVTGEASDKCHKENRRTVNGDDICWALNSLGFDDYAEVMLRYLYKLRDFEKLRANQNKVLGLNDDEDNTDDEEPPSATTSPVPLEFNILERGQRFN
ncbi:nuclear transcription factor Y subunit B-4-like [Solanum dulcamara]|uniref:nuclear transcription factor Y subunit B-4-like n=1 Tax=Solanum dulcamara TaxID=45834 RepID=UPI00248556B7|nr:nuclear transcription factor Y subunit B-4-like [Solanum dulcamara]